MMFSIGDTIAFTRIYYPRRPSRVVATPGAATAIVEPAIEEQILKQSGEGVIHAIHSTERKVQGLTRGGRIKTTVVQTAKVHAGAGLGYVAAVLDDAVLVAKQQSLFDMAADQKSQTMYGTDVKGGA
jgi:hypothetical protein